MPEIDSSIRRHWERLGGKRIPVAELTPDQLRASLAAFVSALEGPEYVQPAMARVDSNAVTTRRGDVPTRVYVPKQQRPGTLVYFHGGGFVGGDLDTHDRAVRFIASTLRIRVVAVDYPRAPEVQFPELVDVCFDGLRQIAKVDPSGPTVLAGDSAGGYLAAALAPCARDAGIAISAQLLFYPVLDFSNSLPAVTEHATALTLHAEDLAAYRQMFLGDDPGMIQRAGLLDGSNLEGLPPTVIATAEFDPLRDDGAVYAGQLALAQVPVVFQPHADLVHGWLEWSEISASARRARLEAVRALADILASAWEV